jgi:hypothetical protein
MLALRGERGGRVASGGDVGACFSNLSSDAVEDAFDV